MEEKIVSDSELKFKSPSLTLVFGPTNWFIFLSVHVFVIMCVMFFSGKSVLLHDLLLNEKDVFESPIDTCPFLKERL